jgi:hypothetical protein
MIPALATLLLAVPAAAPTGADPAPVVRHEEAGPEKVPVRLAAAADVARLCRSLEPAERLRAAGDAVARGEAEASHELARREALKARYEVAVRAAKLAFAPYDGPERRLALQEPVQLPVADGTARLWPTESRGLAVEAEASAARRVLDAQRRGALALALVFDLPEDSTCGTGARGKTFTVPIDPVAWRWLEGDAVLAHGGAAAERPLVSAAQGARPRVEVGEPIAGPAEVKDAVLARARDLESCYGEALKRDPALDGVLVADLGGARAAIAADSVGDADLATCVQKALATLAPSRGGQAAVPIRFELTPPVEPVKVH